MDNAVGTPPSPEQLSHKLAISDVLALHSRGLDRLDAEAIKSAYWPDATVDYGAFKGSAHEFAAIIGPALQMQYELTQHCLGQSLISLSGNQANSETYVTAHHLILGAEEEMVFSGRYFDQLQFRDGAWKIFHRQVIMDWSRTAAVTDERTGEAFAALTKGSHAESDATAGLFTATGSAA